MFPDNFSCKEIKHHIETMGDYIPTCFINNAGIIEYASNMFLQLLECQADDVVGHHYLLVTPNAMNGLDIKQVLNSWHFESHCQTKNGHEKWFECTVLEHNAKSQLLGNLIIYKDISFQKKIENLSVTDELTGLFNRRHLNNIFNDKVKHIRRNKNLLNFILLDIDNFKKYNDTYGHQAGDDVLVAIGKTLKKVFKRSTDVSFRMGGEEFAVIYQTKTKEDAHKLAEIIRDEISSLAIEHQLNEPYGVITSSFGLTIEDLTDNRIELDILYKKTDDLLYKAKHNGRNRIESHS
jgi:diguanylate cyclase (GGDEF)-like protein